MRRLLTHCGLLFVGTTLCVSAIAQQSTTLLGSVRAGKSKEAISAVSVTVKGGSAGTFTDDKGNFKFTTVQKLPITLVFSSVGYASKEVVIRTNNEMVTVDLETSFTLGDEVVVAASRVPERILESPVSIERISTAAIRNSPATNYYDMITNLKGVDVVVASLTFRSVGTRGFNNSGNSRLNQLVDGMDNQAPGLNFSVGSVLGLTELDVESMELLPGASSALYGSGGMNGTVLINSKNPFKYQGLSFQVKQGIKDIDGYQRPLSSYNDWSLRWAQKVSEKFAFKIGAQFMQAKDWLANQNENYLRPPTPGAPAPNGAVTGGTRTTDPNYDGVNFYGDETNLNIGSTATSVIASTGLPAANITAFNNYIAANPGLTLAGFNAFLNSAGAGALVAAGASPFIYGQSPARNYFGNRFVSRTGYAESDIINPMTVNVKLSGSVHYKLSDKTEASFLAYWGTGNSVYTGSDRYSLSNLKMGQYKLEVKSKNWFVRAYTTHENSGDSYNATITTRLFNEAWKPSTTWFPTYMSALVAYRDAGMNDQDANNAARAVADVGRPTGFVGNNPLFKKVASTPISQGGGLFLDRTRLNVLEGQYNLSNDLNLAKNGTDFLIGASVRRYILNSQGTLFADTAGTIKIDEVGAYAQLSQKLLNDVLKLTVSGRYDKNSNFDGRFTPRASAVVKLAKDHNLRFSYQQAYRFPTTQNQWINLTVGGGSRLLGGLQQLRDFYRFGTNPGYTPESVGAFAANLQATGVINTSLLASPNYGKFKPESSTSYEVGYKGLIGQRLLIDAYAYWATYKDFLSSVTVLQARNQPSGPAGYLDLLDASKRIGYSISVNTPGDVKTMGWGISAEYLMRRNYSVSANLYSDEIGDLPVGFVSYFNTPKYRANIAFNNSGFLKDNRYGFSVVYRWVDNFFYEGTFGSGQMPSYGTLDAVVSYKLLSTKSIIKLGATNVLNAYYRTGFGNPQVGGLYYVSFGWNVF